MIRTVCFAAVGCMTLAASAFAEDNITYPATVPNYPIHRSLRTNQIVVIPPYRHVFTVRIYTTPQQQPYYNVPPYPVVTPY